MVLGIDIDGRHVSGDYLRWNATHRLQERFQIAGKPFWMPFVNSGECDQQVPRGSRQSASRLSLLSVAAFFSRGIAPSVPTIVAPDEMSLPSWQNNAPGLRSA